MSDRRGKLYIISGPSGVGKSTVLHEVFSAKPDLQFSVSVTTRKPRPGETDGVDYHFISDKRYDDLLAHGLLLEHASYSGNRYGTPAQPIWKWLESGKDVILDIESVGMRNVKAKMPDAVSVFIAPPDWETLEQRLRSRATETEEKVLMRLKAAHREMDASERYDYIIVNDEVARAAGEFLAVMSGERKDRKGE